MIKKSNQVQSEMIMYTMEELVPGDSLFRKIDKYIDFTFIYNEVQDLYCEGNGRPSDPVVLFKLVLIQAIDGIKSMRKTCAKVKVDAEYRWFLRIPFGQVTPHFSTFSKNYERRFKNSNIFEKIFINIVNQAISYGLVDGHTFFTDSTHKKANANKNKYDDEVVTMVKKRRQWLEDEINEERVKNGQKAFVYQDKTEEKHLKVSKTDPESGYYQRDNKEKGFMYLDHRTTDVKHNIIVDSYVTKGNVHDSVPYIDRLEYLKATFGFDIKEVALDSGYNSLDIKKYLYDQEIFGVIGYRRYGTKDSRAKRNQFTYIQEQDIYIHKETGEILDYTHKIDRPGYKKYTNMTKDKVILRHIEEDLNELFNENRLSTIGRALYSLRKEKIERSFADSKCNHGFRFAMYKGVQKNQHYTWLSCAAQNMKNIALIMDRLTPNHTINATFLKIYQYFQNLTILNPLAFSSRGLSTVC